MEYYADCSLPLPLFIKIRIGNDHKHLIKSGCEEPDAEQKKLLEQAWLAINDQFAETIADNKTIAFALSLNRISHLAAKVLSVQMLVESAREYPDDRIIGALREHEFDVEIDTASPEDLTRSLNRVMTELKSDEIELEELIAIQLRDNEQQQKNIKPVTEAEFEEMLIEMGESAGTRYRAEELTTLQYAILIKRYLKKVKK